MKRLPIADCRLPIKKSFAGRSFTRRRHDGGQFVGLDQQRGKFPCGHNARLDKQLKPEGRFIRFFFDGSDFSYKFALAAGAATGTIIRRHRSTAADDLFGDDASGIVGLGDGTGKFDDSQCKCFRASFEFNWIHGANLQIQSATGNRQSAIQE
jgi:hypothetical protein